jgi:hypothetical protein
MVQAQEQQPKHSGVGVASFILSLVSVIGTIGAFIAASMMASALAGDPTAAASGDMSHLDEGTLGRFIVVAGLMFLFVVTALIGAVLGLVGLFQKRRRKLFPILGLAFNSLLVLSIFLVLLIGIFLGPTLPGTFGGS